MNILIADDDVGTRISLCMGAEKWGYSVTSASDGWEVLKILQSHETPVPQLIVLDWVMPGIDGIELCKQLRSNPRTKSAYVILLTSRSQKSEIVQGLEAGADDYMIKPFSPDELRARLRTGERIIGLQNNLANRVSELEQTIDKLHKSETTLTETAEYRNLFRHANDSIIVFDPENHEILDVNEKACKVYKIRRENFIGRSLKHVAREELRHEEMVQAVLRNGKAEEFEIIHLRSDGRTIDMLANLSFIKFNGRKAVLCVNRDITSRREVEMLIKTALEEWSDTVDAVSDMIVLTDPNNNIMRCNKATANFLNRGFTELIGQSLSEILGFSTSSELSQASIEGDTAAPTPLIEKVWEGRIADRPDEWFEITNHRAALAKSNRLGDHWVHIIKNVTERKRSETSLTLLSTAVEQAADSIVVTCAEGIVQYVNPAFVSCTGWSRDEATGHKMTDLHAAELEPALRNGKADFELPERVWQGVYRARRKTGENYEEEISISPVRDGVSSEILHYVAVCRDVTEKKRLESIAEAVNMMQNVGYVFSGIRHELGNPINSVKTALTVLKKNLTKWETAQIDTYVERCLTETERVEYLLRALKTFSMHENLRMQTVALTAFMHNFISLIDGDLQGRGVAIKLALHTEVGGALCDPRALHQVLLNLITNAADALYQLDEPLITISLAKDKQRIYVCVEDNGCGMSEQQVENLFKPFYTSKEGGTGLGLVIVKKMITNMNGTIHIESIPVEGTKVRFTLESAS